MDYQQAADTRKKGLFSAITDKLVAGQGIGSSVGGAISEKTQATVKGFKEKFDILNIAKTLTGGSNLAPALLGRMMGRKKEDIAYFAGAKNKKIGGLSSTKTNEMAVEVLGLIYREMVRTEEQRKIDFADAEAEKNKELEAEDTRNKQIIAALTGRKRPTKKVKVEKKKKETKEKKPKAGAPAISIGKKGVETISKLSPFKTIQKAITTVVTPSRVAGGAILGAAGISAAAAISIKGETGKTATSKQDILDKAGQVVQNDPKPGVTSYGIFGMNSGSGTVQQFLAENPQFGITAKPATPEFDKQWKEVAKQKGPEFLDAQLMWHDKHIVQTLRKELTNKLPRGVQPNEQVLAYMADRRIQYGRVQEQSALQYASGAKTPAEWIEKMTEYDLSNLGTAFSTYLKQHPEAKKGLINRLEMRKSMALSVSPDNNTGNQIEQSSKVNKDARAQSDTSTVQQKNVNTTNVSSSNQYAQNAEKEDDRSAYDKKVKQR
jgi:hypothetical protein